VLKGSIMIKISVITPSFNQGRFIANCLASVQAQQGNFALEHIVLDNCSTDDTSKILSAHKLANAKSDFEFLIQPDYGQTDAINKGFSMSSGDIVCWLNTDEWYADGAVAQVVNFFETHPNIDVVYGDCDFVDSKGNLIKRKREYNFSKSMLLYYGCYIPSCSTFVRRKVIDDGVILRPEFKVAMDFDWYVNMAAVGYRFAHMPVTLATFTWHESNISSTFVERRLQERRLVQDRYTGVRGPSWFRSIFFAFMRFFWIGFRVIRRAVK
jgi:glycosyltransferase involved in cell wall biosynthesis